MTRRLTWLAAGAILGIVGYRRIGRAARAILPPAVHGRAALASRQLPGRVSRQLPGRVSRELPVRVPRQPGDQSPPRAPGRLAASAAFIRDVRTGMAEYLDRREAYMDRHAGRLGNTLVGQEPRRPPL